MTTTSAGSSPKPSGNTSSDTSGVVPQLDPKDEQLDHAQSVARRIAAASNCQLNGVEINPQMCLENVAELFASRTVLTVTERTAPREALSSRPLQVLTRSL
jgi:hypothetical protein